MVMDDVIYKTKKRELILQCNCVSSKVSGQYLGRLVV